MTTMGFIRAITASISEKYLLPVLTLSCKNRTTVRFALRCAIRGKPVYVLRFGGYAVLVVEDLLKDMLRWNKFP